VFENSFFTTGLNDWGFKFVASKDERVDEEISTKSESFGEFTVLFAVFIFELIMN